MVDALHSPSNSYRPVHAASLTGTFPGFARPHFAPADPRTDGSLQNTIYVQHVLDERIVTFEPLESATDELIPLSDASNVGVGDDAVYVYAFDPKNAVVGSRDAIVQAIMTRFREIEPQTFAACTAAQFARLTQRLPDLNRRAFRILADISTISSCQWRDSVVFQTALRDALESLQIPPQSARLRTHERNGTLEVELSLTHGIGKASSQQIESTCRNLLINTGLFNQNDVLTLHLENTGDHDSKQLRMLEAGDLDNLLNQAKFFLEERVFLPALQGTAPRVLNIVRNTRHWISKFTKIGDLVRYMDRFRPDPRQAAFPFPELKQIRFEDVYAEFSSRFGPYRGFQTTIADFLYGKRYSAFTLAIYTRTYDNRGGGIRPVGKIGQHEAVVINITLSGAKYANEWLEEGDRLKCYLRSPRGLSEVQSEESHDANRSIMKYPEVPVLLFTRSSGEPDFLYQGIFRCVSVSSDQGGKWFELLREELARPLR